MWMPRPRVLGSGALGGAVHICEQQRWCCPSHQDELPFSLGYVVVN